MATKCYTWPVVDPHMPDGQNSKEGNENLNLKQTGYKLLEM